MRINFKGRFRSAKRECGRLRRWIVTALTVSLFVLGPTGNASAASSAKSDLAGFVTTVGERVVEVLDAQGLETDQRLRHFRDIFVNALGLDTVARRVLGRHWRTATDAQRERYVTLFRQYVVSMYAVQLGGYSGATFTVLRQQILRKKESLVVARFTHESGPPLGMNVLVRQMNGHFKIIDVTIAGISLVVTKRSEFDAVIRREGMTGLLRRLDEKQATMLRRQQEFIP
jgi:phospholipid transport system substrate-binding protein